MEGDYMKGYRNIMGVFLAEDMVRIFYQCWIVDKPKGVLIISHGLGDHSGRYMNLIETLAGKNISIYALDHRGHGRSGGKRGHVDSFMKYIIDLKQLMDDIVSKENKNIPIILLGHSMGGLIAAKYALTYPGDLNGMILSAPSLIPAVKVPKIKILLGRILSKIAPTKTLNNELDPADISTDLDVVKAYREDPLVHDRVSARWYTEFINTAADCLKRASEIRMPLLLVHGTGDKMVSVESSKQIYDKSESTDKQIHFFNGLFHETMNEKFEGRKKVLKLISDWIILKVSARKKK
jgi:acylglycerol lipase